MFRHFLKLLLINILIYIALRWFSIISTVMIFGSGVSGDYFVSNAYVPAYILQIGVLLILLFKNRNKEFFRIINYLIIASIITFLFIGSRKGIFPIAFEYFL